MFPQLAEKLCFTFLATVLFTTFLFPVVPLWGKPLQVHSTWLTSGRNNQLLKIKIYDQNFGYTSRIKIDLGVGVQVDSHQYDPKEKELFLKIKSVNKETNLGPRPLIIKIPSKTTSLENSKYKQIKSKIWIFSPGMVKVDQFNPGKKNVIRLKITGENTHFKNGRTRIVFKNGNGITVEQDNIFVINSTYLTADLNIGAIVQPGQYSFYVETLKEIRMRQKKLYLLQRH